MSFTWSNEQLTIFNEFIEPTNPVLAIEANPGSAKSGTVNGATTVSHNAATVATATVTIIQSANQTIHVYTPQKSGGTDHTSTFTCPIGTTYEAEVVAASGYLPGDLSVN